MHPQTHIISIDNTNLRGGQVNSESLFPVWQELQKDKEMKKLLVSANGSQHFLPFNQFPANLLFLAYILRDPVLTRGKSSGSIQTMLRSGLSVLSSATFFRISRNSKPSEEWRGWSQLSNCCNCVYHWYYHWFSFIFRVPLPGSASSAKAMICSPSTSSDCEKTKYKLNPLGLNDGSLRLQPVVVNL